MLIQILNVRSLNRDIGDKVGDKDVIVPAAIMSNDIKISPRI